MSDLTSSNDSIEEGLKSLKKLSEKIENENTPIDEALKAFEDASVLAEKLKLKLKGYEEKVKVTINKFQQAESDRL